MSAIPAAERLADDGDRATANDEAFRARALQAVRDRAQELPQLQVGICRNCMERPIAGVYCDDDCEKDHARRAGR